MKNLNIVLYVNSFLPRTAGRELVVRHLAVAMQNLGHKVRVIGPSGYLQNRKYRFEFPVHRFPALGSVKLWRKSNSSSFDTTTRTPFRALLQEKLSLWQLRFDLFRWGGDIVHAHNTYPTGYTVAQLKKRKNIPLVITPHGEDIHKIPEIGFGLRLNPVLEKRIKYSLDKAEVITAISDGVEKSVLDAGASGNKIKRIPNGVDLERFSNTSEVDVLEWLGLPHDARLIVSVGNYHPRKGHEVLVRAMPGILSAIPNTYAVIVGSRTDALHPLMHELELEKNVVLTGAIPTASYYQTRGDADKNDARTDYLAALLQKSEIYISAGINEGAEGLSLALLEGMAAGLPVVATRISGNRDVITEGENGILVPPGNSDALSRAIILLMTNKENRKNYGANAKAFASQYDWNVIATRYIEIYREIIDSSKRA